MNPRILTISAIISVVVIAILVIATAPSIVGPIGILTVFIGIYVVLLTLCVGSIFFGSRLVIFIAKNVLRITSKGRPIAYRRAYYYGTIVALVPMMMMGLHASGALTGYGVLLVLLFCGLGIFYVSRRTF